MQGRVLEGEGRPRATVGLILLGLLVLLVAAGSVQRASAQHAAGAATPSGPPIVVGSTLSLTGSFAATGIIHKIAGDTYVKWINSHGGLLGRPVQWKVLDDESDASKVSALYERLISQDKVDLIMGPYATPNIVAAQAVAERHGYVLPNHTAVLTYALSYDCQFPTWSTGVKPNLQVPQMIFSALKSQAKPPKRIAFVTNTGGSTNFISYGPPNSSEGGAVEAAKKAGFDVVLDLKYPPTVSDWGSIAAQVRDAKPDLVWNDGLAVDPVSLIQAMRQLDYKAPQFFTLFPASGPLLSLGANGENILSVSLFEPAGRLLKRLGTNAKQIVAQFGQGARAAKLAYPVFDSQAAASWTAWETLAAGVAGAKSTDNAKVCSWLKANPVKTTFVGTLRFNPSQNNFPPAHMAVKQVQNGRWTIVWPRSLRTARLLAPGGRSK
jgi:branched-chain amino acid transport system substrate-binding protein